MLPAGGDHTGLTQDSELPASPPGQKLQAPQGCLLLCLDQNLAPRGRPVHIVGVNCPQWPFVDQRQFPPKHGGWAALCMGTPRTLALAMCLPR